MECVINIHSYFLLVVIYYLIYLRKNRKREKQYIEGSKQYFIRDAITLGCSLSTN